jgi:hypothetical protein
LDNLSFSRHLENYTYISVLARCSILGWDGMG